MTDLPVVDPTTGLVDPDWSLLSPEHRAQIESLQLTVARLRTHNMQLRTRLAAYEELETAAEAWLVQLIDSGHYRAGEAATWSTVRSDRWPPEVELVRAVEALPHGPVPPLSATESAEQAAAPLTDTEATDG